MEILMWYALFAVTTSATAMYELFIPVMGKLPADNSVVKYKFITYATFFLLSLLVAPLLLPSCIVPSFSSRFRETLLKSLQ